MSIDATTTLDGLRAFVETSIPGSAVKVDTGGRLTVTSPPGTDQEVTALSLSTGGAAPLFDTAFSSSTATVAASGVGAIQANDVLHLAVGTLSFDGVPVLAGELLGERDRGFAVAMRTLDLFRPSVGAFAVGMAQAALDAAVAHASTRAAFGGPLAGQQAVAHLLFGPPPANDSDLVNLARELDNIERQVAQS